jgi:GMP synthase-like glutamine amidotransferase
MWYQKNEELIVCSGRTAMRLHVIQHVDFEGPALIAEWAEARGHELTACLALTEEYPTCEEIDFLVVMGGPMDADDETKSPWLHAEKHYIAECVAAGHAVLGVCLGAQIIAEVLGGTVKRNPEREIGWYTVEKTEEGGVEPLFAGWPETLVVGQWHGDTFDLPAGLEPVYSSEACVNQAFVFDRRAVGLQFHIEWTEPSLAGLVDHCRDELTGGALWVMSESEIVDEAPERIVANREWLFSLLDALMAESRVVLGRPML